jgi:glyoxylase I family protein
LPLHHLALRCADIERTARFYVERLGLRERARHCTDTGALRSIWLDAAGVVVMLERRAETEPAIDPASMELVAFAIDRGDMAAARERLAVIEAETAFTLYARDPDGRRVALSCYAFDP